MPVLLRITHWPKSGLPVSPPGLLPPWSEQSCAARLVKRYPKYGRTSPLLFELHWLPVEHRIVFKILLLVFKSLNNLAPSYISDLLTPYIPSRSLRSSNQSLLVVPRSIQKSYGLQSFRNGCPSVVECSTHSYETAGFFFSCFKQNALRLTFPKRFFFQIFCDFM